MPLQAVRQQLEQTDIALRMIRLYPDDLVQGLEDVSRYPCLIAELLRRGWSEENISKLARTNLLRVFGQVEKVARRR